MDVSIQNYFVFLGKANSICDITQVKLMLFPKGILTFILFILAGGTIHIIINILLYLLHLGSSPL